MPNNFGKDEETKATRDYNEGWAKWVEYNKQYYDLFDMNITGLIIDKTRLSNEVFSAYSQFSPVGAFHNDRGRQAGRAVYGDTVYAYLLRCRLPLPTRRAETPDAEKVDFSNPNMVKVFKNMASYDRSMKGFSAYKELPSCQDRLSVLKRFYRRLYRLCQG